MRGENSNTSNARYQFITDYWGDGWPGADGVINGPISVPSGASALNGVQQPYSNPSLSTMPVTGYIDSWYGVDIAVTPVSAPPSISGAISLKKMVLSASVTDSAGISFDSINYAGAFLGSSCEVRSLTGSTMTTCCCFTSMQSRTIPTEIRQSCQSHPRVPTGLNLMILQLSRLARLVVSGRLAASSTVAPPVRQMQAR